MKPYRAFMAESKMNYAKFARERGYKKAKITMVRVPVYARADVSAFKETTVDAFVKDPKAKDSSTVYWRTTIGTMNRDRNGDWSSINTDKARYDIVKIKF